MRAGVRLFGKLPAHGDFVARGLPALERDALDAWLSASLAEAQAQLGDAFEERFGSAQPWRFAGEGRAGALAPSTDATGRRYPLLLAVEAEPGIAADAAAMCEALLYDAIVGGWTADILVAHADAIVGRPGTPPSAGWWLEGVPACTLSEARPAGLLRAVLSVAEHAA